MRAPGTSDLPMWKVCVLPPATSCASSTTTVYPRFERRAADVSPADGGGDGVARTAMGVSGLKAASGSIRTGDAAADDDVVDARRQLARRVSDLELWRRLCSYVGSGFGGHVRGSRCRILVRMAPLVMRSRRTCIWYSNKTSAVEIA